MNPKITYIPSGWRKSRVGCEFFIENNLREPLSSEERKNLCGPYPYYGPTKAVDFLDHYRIEGTYALIGEDGDHFLKYNIQDMTQLISGKFNVNNHAHLVRGKGECITEWFYEYFRGRALTPFLTRQEAARYKLNKVTLEELPILVPSLGEQKYIHEYIKKWDNAITVLEKLTFEKNKLKAGLMQQLHSGKKRFPVFILSNKNQVTKHGSIPVDWEYPPISKIAKDISMKNKENKDLPVLSCTKHHGLVDSLKYFTRRVFSENISTYKIVGRNQFAYATNHIEEGSIGYQNLYDDAAISPMYTVFETNSDVNDRYLYLLLKTEKYRRIFEANTNASVDRRGSLRWKDFSAIHIPLPSMEEQEAIAHVFDLLDKELLLLQQQLNEFKEQKKGLMQQLLTGKKRVTLAKVN